MPPRTLDRLPTLPDVDFSNDFLKPRVGKERSLVSLGVQILLFLALLAVAIVFRQEVGNAIVWLGTKIAGTSTPEISLPARNDTPFPTAAAPSSSPTSKPETPNAGNPNPSNSSSESSQRSSDVEHKEEPTSSNKKNEETSAAPESTSPLPAKNPALVAPGTVLPLTRPSTPLPSGSVFGQESGQSEFLAAQDILRRNAVAELPEAVKLLWTAVEKGNASAEVALAELYRQGKGVAKNCDQTNILLSAAARKGNALAQKLLKEFQSDSCE